jgi:hypothetical protein
MANGKVAQASRRPLIDLTGQRFGYWTVLQRAPNGPGKTTRWLCKCELCGREVIVQRNNLTNGKSTRCGKHRQLQAQEAQLLRVSRIARGIVK